MHHAYRDVRIAIPCVQDVYVFGRINSFFIYIDGQQIDFSCINIFIEHVHCQGIVNIVADVRFHNDAQRSRRFSFFATADDCQRKRQAQEES